MAYTFVLLSNKLTGQIREAPIGFSWTTLFFGALVPLFREDWKWAVLQFIIALITGGLSWLIFPFCYNNLYINDLVKNGFKMG